MKKYDAYKNSGVEWIGEIPKGWECLPMKRGLVINNGKDYKDVQSEEGYPVIGSGGQFACATEYLYDGEAVLLGRKGTIDKPMYINGKFWTVDTMFYAVPLTNVECKYMYYQALTIPFGKYSTNTALPSMTQSDLSENPMCFPSKEEQQAIASYLDHKVGQIDASVSAINTQIEGLKAYRQSIISEAVTKGLNPNVPMKDSGIEWIGEIPEGWECLKLALVTSKIGSGKTPTGGAEVYIDSGVMFIRSQNVYDDGLRKNDIVFISDTIHQNMQNSKVYDGDVLLNITGGSIGRSCLINDIAINANVNQHVCIVRSKKDVLYSAFLHYYIVSSYTQNQIKACQTGGNREELNFEQIGKFQITLPPLSEQQAIASYLDSKTSKIDATIASLESQRDDLNALKQSVISEAVTGKVDVREWKKD